MDRITVTAKTVDEAITKAALQLETSSDMLDVEIVEKGSPGFLGIGTKLAIIKVNKKDEKALELASDDVPVQPVVKESEFVKEQSDIKPEEQISKENYQEKQMEAQARVRTFLNDTFRAMGMEVIIDITCDGKEMNIDLSGQEMGVLIGKRGQTLDSLQYLVSLVANKEHDGYLRVKLDTENYRERRKETLETLAKNIAYKVKRTRRSVALEPMNPYERRIIHAALQHDKYVITKSEGEDPFRHVVILLKKESMKKDRY